jgi:hypothetical protein
LSRLISRQYLMFSENPQTGVGTEIGGANAYPRVSRWLDRRRVANHGQQKRVREVFEPWKECCLKCLSLLTGADHHYTHCFKSYVQHPDSLSLLAAGGPLEAARQEFSKIHSVSSGEHASEAHTKCIRAQETREEENTCRDKSL